MDYHITKFKNLTQYTQYTIHYFNKWYAILNCKLKEIMKLLSKTNYANINICILTYYEQE